MLNLLRLTVFREVARRGSFSLAAQTLAYSQPAVSHHVTSLEREIGAKLLERGPRGELSLTEAGAVTLAQAETLLEAATIAEQEITRSVNSDSAVHLGVSGGAPIVADTLARFLRAHPTAEIKLFEVDLVDVVGGLRGRNLDLAVGVHDPADPIPDDVKFVSEPLYDDPMLLVLPEGHRLANADTVELGELAQENWIDRASDTPPWLGKHACPNQPWSAILTSACCDAGFTPHIAMSARNPLMVQRLVVAGVGLALLSELALVDPHPLVRLRRFSPHKTRRLFLAQGTLKSNSRNVEMLAAALRETAVEYTRFQPARLEKLLANCPLEATDRVLTRSRRGRAGVRAPV